MTFFKNLLYQKKKKINSFVKDCLFSFHHRNESKLFVNSIQKAGTHLLTNALDKSIPQKNLGRGIYSHELTKYRIDKEKQGRHSIDSIMFAVNKFNQGEIFRGHVEWDSSFSDYLYQNRIPVLLIIRNPLDILLSLANWWERHDEIAVEPYRVFKSIEDPEEKMRFLITGIYDNEKIWQDIVSRLRNYSGWFSDPNCHVVEFESIINSPYEVVQQISNHLKIEINASDFVEGLNPAVSKTYTNELMRIHTNISDHNINIFRELGGFELMNDWGYIIQK